MAADKCHPTHWPVREKKENSLELKDSGTLTTAPASFDSLELKDRRTLTIDPPSFMSTFLKQFSSQLCVTVEYLIQDQSYFQNTVPVSLQSCPSSWVPAQWKQATVCVHNRNWDKIQSFSLDVFNSSSHCSGGVSICLAYNFQRSFHLCILHTTELKMLKKSTCRPFLNHKLKEKVWGKMERKEAVTWPSRCTYNPNPDLKDECITLT